MTLQKFLFIAFVIFLLGIGVLYTGINRVPFRNSGHEHHTSALSTSTAVHSSNKTHSQLTMPDNTAYLIQENEQRS